MDEPASFSHLAGVIETSVVVTPHGRGHKGKEHCPPLIGSIRENGKFGWINIW